MSKQIFEDVIKFPSVSTPSFETFKKERPYKPTKAFTEWEWHKHLYELWKGMYGIVHPLKEYTVITNSGIKYVVHASNYMNAKLTACKEHKIPLNEINSIL